MAITGPLLIRRYSSEILADGELGVFCNSRIQREKGLYKAMDSIEPQMGVQSPSAALNARREAVRAVIARYPVTNPRVFGSVLHGTDRQGSDLDILVDSTAETDLFNLGGLYSELEDLLGVKIDLLTPGDLPAKLRTRILAEAMPI